MPASLRSQQIFSRLCVASCFTKQLLLVKLAAVSFISLHSWLFLFAIMKLDVFWSDFEYLSICKKAIPFWCITNLLFYRQRSFQPAPERWISLWGSFLSPSLRAEKTPPSSLQSKNEKILNTDNAFWFYTWFFLFSAKASVAEITRKQSLAQFYRTN